MSKFPRECNNCSQSFYNFAGEPPTASEIRSAKAEAVGGGPKKCVKGKSCSATCIAANEDCLVEFPEPIQAEIRKMAQYIVNRRTKEGRAISEEEDVALGTAVQGLGRHLTQQGTYQRGSGKYKKETEERTFGTTQFGQQRNLGNKEIENLKANRDRIVNTENDMTLRRAWQRDTQSRGVKLDRKSLEDVYDSLDMAAQQQLNSTGSPGKGKFYGGVDKNGNPITNASSANKERGLAVLDLYLRQGGTDAYQIGDNKAARRVLSPADLDIEHVRPMAQAKKDGGKDEPSNWVLARSGAQRTRSDDFFKDFIDSLPDTKNPAEMREYYSIDRKKRQATRAMNRISQEVYNNRDKYTDQEFLKMVSLAKPSAKKSGEISVNPIAKKIFRNEDGTQDGFFTTPSLNKPGAAGGRGAMMPQPAGWAKAYLLERRVGTPESAGALRAEIRDIWNKQWLGGQISTQQMVNQVENAYKSRLSPEAWKAVEKDVKAASAKLVKAYGDFGRQGGGDGSIPAPKGGGMSQKQAVAALDDLLKSL